jgi:hypothetical protein
MRRGRCITAAIALALTVFASGCGTPREKTAPCKRPANLTGYASMEGECGPMISVNADRAAAVAAIQDLVSGDEE